MRWKSINYYKGYFLNWCQQCQPYQKTLVDCHKFGYSTRLMHTMLILKNLIKQVRRNEQFVKKTNMPVVSLLLLLTVVFKFFYQNYLMFKSMKVVKFSSRQNKHD